MGSIFSVEELKVLLEHESRENNKSKNNNLNKFVTSEYLFLLIRTVL